MKHRDIQPAHEEAVLDSFSDYLQKHGGSLKVVNRPNPPDAIVTINGKSCWIEITDAFQSSGWAKSITSYAADDRVHEPYVRGAICEPDIEACEKVKEVILKKYRKKTMKNLRITNGPGILLVGAYTPITLPEEIIEQAGHSICLAIAEEEPVFGSIYLYRNSTQGHIFSRLF